MTGRLAAPLAAVFALVAGAAAAQPLGIGTSPQGTLNYTLGATYAKALDDALEIQARVQPSSGTAVVVPLVDSGELDVGFVNTLELTEAYTGTGTFKRPHKELRTIGVLFPIRVGFFVRKDSPVTSVRDIKGKAIAYGYTSQEIIRTVVDGLLANAGLAAKDMRTVLVPNLVRGAEEFISGKVEVGFFALGQAKIAETDAAVGGIRFLPLLDEPDRVEAMTRIVPTSYLDTVQPAPNLPGVAEPLKTMHYDYVMFANAGLPKERVEQLTQVLVEQRDAMAAGMPLFRQLKVERMWRAGFPVPYHDGALAYYKAKGITEGK
jgi:TRAP transporter TAXI family solute receptor